MTTTTDQAVAKKRFDDAWKGLAGLWYRQDKGLNTGRNAHGTAATERMQFARLKDAYYAMDEPTVKQMSRFGYAERRVKLGRTDAERYKANAQSTGRW